LFRPANSPPPQQHWKTNPRQPPSVAFSEHPPSSALEAQQDWIDACYAADDAEEILRRMRAAGGEAAKAADTIESKSPTSVKVALASLRRGRELSLDEALAQEYRVGLRCLVGPDFREGIRAQVIDKDRNPQWQPPTLSQVRTHDVERYFAPLGERELILLERESDGVRATRLWVGL
jgi:enoyl-CoA hydratase